jgi:hypothetical protein
MIGPISHDLQQLREGLLQRPSLVYIDTETTGLERCDSVLSIGIRFGGVNYILFTSDCTSNSIVPYIRNDEQIRWALRPLEGIRQVYHSVFFDLPRLRRFGVRFNEWIVDTLQLIRLLDQDRGFDSANKRHRPRLDLTAPGGPRYENCRLKDVCSQLCGIKAFYTPEMPMLTVPLETHRRYLAHDLFCTERLYKHLWQRMSQPLRTWWLTAGAPLTHELYKLTQIGVAADAAFIESEVKRIGEAMAAISNEHTARHGAALVDMNDETLRKLIYEDYGLPQA